MNFCTCLRHFASHANTIMGNVGDELRSLVLFQTLAGLSDQDSYYDMVDGLEEQGIEALGQRHLSRKGTDLDLVEQVNIYEVRKASAPEARRAAEPVALSCTSVQMTLRHEDGDDDAQLPPNGRKERRRASVGGTNERRGLERRRSRRHSLQNPNGHASAPASPCSPHAQGGGGFLAFSSSRIDDISER